MNTTQPEDARKLLEAVPDALVVVGEDGRIASVNARTGEMFGYTSDDLLGQPVEMLVPEAFRAGHPAHRENYMAEPATKPMGMSLEVSGRRKDGRKFPVDVMLTPWVEGGKKRVLAAIRDITHRRRIEAESEQRIAEALDTSEQRYRTLVENSLDTVCELAMDGRYLYVSPNVEAITGRTPQELLGTCAFDRVHPDDLPEVMTKFGLPQAIASFRLRHKDGSWRWLESIGRDYETPDGETRAVVFTRDITERKRAEEVLKQAQRLARIGHWEWNVAGGRHWSEEIYGMFGRDPALPPAAYPDVKQYFTPESWAPLSAAVEKAMTDGTPYECDAEVVRPDGSRRWITARGEAVLDAEGKVFSLHGTIQDITGRNLAEDALRDSEENFRAFFENVGTGAAQIDATGRFIRVNDRFCALTGYSRTELLGGMGPLDLDHPDDHEKDREEIEQLIKGKGYSMEKRYLAKDGRVVWVRVTTSPILDAAGRFCSSAAVIEDITARKRIREELRESEERFRNIFEHAGMGISITDLKGRFEQCNPAYCAITGYSGEELSRMEFSSLIHPDDRKENMRLVRALVDREIPSFGVENRYVRKTGEPVWVRKFVTILRNDQGCPTHLLSLITDITSRMRKDAAIERQAGLLHLSHDAIFVWSTGGGIEFWNKGATDLYGYHASEIRGRVSRELLKAGFPVPWPQIEAELRELGTWEGEVRHTTKAGDEVIVASRLQVVPDGGGALLVLETNRDITERVRLEREILAISEAERQRFGQELHDDLGQQLTAVMMMTGILADDLRKKSPRQADDLGKLVELLKHAMQATRRMARGLYPAELEGGDLVIALEGLCTTVETSSGIPCEFSRDPAFHLKNPDAAIHLYRIVQEALNNAVKHGGASRITVGCAAPAGRLAITVTNDGRHMKLPTKKAPGMGLSLMKYRARLLGGELAVRPVKTGGCIVTCSIPAKQADPS